jgi:hypothetical protein
MSTVTLETWEFSPIALDSTPLGTFQFDYDPVSHVVTSIWDTSSPSTNLLLAPSDNFTNETPGNMFNLATESANQFSYFRPLIMRATSAFASKYGMALNSAIVLQYDINRTVMWYKIGADVLSDSLGTFVHTNLSSREVSLTLTRFAVQIQPLSTDAVTTLFIDYDQFRIIRGIYDSTNLASNILRVVPFTTTNENTRKRTLNATNTYPINNGITFNRPSSFTITGTRYYYLTANSSTSYAMYFTLNNGGSWPGVSLNYFSIGYEYDSSTGLSFGPFRTLLVTYNPDGGVLTAYGPDGTVRRTWTGLNISNPDFPDRNYIALTDTHALIQGLVCYNRPLNASEIETVYHALENTPLDPTAGLPSPAPGTVTLYAGASNGPIGSVPCDGSALYRSTYANLFNTIGTTFGSGDGTNTFNVPDFSAETKPTGTNYVIKL